MRFIQQWREADHAPPSNARTKNVWSYTITPHHVFMAWYSVNHRNKFIFTLMHFIHISSYTQGNRVL